MAGLAAANYDPAHFEHPEELILDRAPNPHIEFGAGTHFCLGFQLARLELKTALTVLWERFPNLSLVSDRPRWARRAGLRALEELRVAAKN